MSKKKRVFGERIDLPCLAHAPVNELGVVFLFGYLTKSLDIEVESIHAGYPDCLAKRKVGKGKYETLKIEFEYESKNFITHQHDPNEVDMIVCWKHNCDEIPENVEVLDLRKFLEEGGIIPPKPPTRLTEWQLFCREMRKEGYSFEEIAEMWRGKTGEEWRRKRNS